MKKIKINKTPTDDRVSVIPVLTRRLVIYKVGDEIANSRVEGSIVWVKPKQETTPEELAASVSFLKKMGAARVVAMPLEAQHDAVPMNTLEEIDVGDEVNARAAVEELLGEIKEQSEETREIVESALAEVGL